MYCMECGKEISEGKVCAECMGVDEKRPEDFEETADTRSDELSEEDNTAEKEYEKKIEHFENGSCIAPDRKKGKKNILHWRNPMLREFFLTLALGLLFTVIDLLIFKSVCDSVPNSVYYFICCTIIALGMLAFAFVFRMPRAFKLDRMQRGKSLRSKWTLSRDEVEDAAHRLRNKNRFVYLLTALLSLALLIYSIASYSEISFFFLLVTVASAVLVLIFGFLFFFMPKYNYERVIKNGRDVLIGDDSVYVYGRYYYFSNINPRLTYAHMNTKKHILTVEFATEKTDGGVTKKSVEVYVPENAEKKAIALIGEYETSVKSFRAGVNKTADKVEKK